jgi:hypothetical protein
LQAKGHENKGFWPLVLVKQHNSGSAMAPQVVTFSVATSHTTNLATLA